LAFDRDLTAHQGNQPPTNRQTQASAAIAAIGRSAKLAKGREDILHAIGWNTNPRVGDREA